MFSFFGRRRQVELHRLVRRFIDTSTPNHTCGKSDARWENRANRSLPVLLAPSDGKRVGLDELVHAVTKDLSSQGLALVLPHPFRAERVVIGFWSQGQTYFMSGTVRQNVPLGGGFWQLGVELEAQFEPSDRSQLVRLTALASRLDPRVNLDALNAMQTVRG